MNSFLQIMATVLVIFSAIMSVPVMIRLRQPVSTPTWWGVKVFAGALAPFFAITGAMGMILGILTGSIWSSITGGYAVLFFVIYLYRVNLATKYSLCCGKDFATGWQNNFSDREKAKFLLHPISWRLPTVAESEFQLKQNIPFCTIPDTNRHLLCDVWQPSKSIQPSGLAFIYFHGSAWCVLDKDFGTRPFFKHLVAQGHVIMDVAYRLFPETDMSGMVNDVYRAIAWMKAHAVDYGASPDVIVIGGASAGGHLSLLASYNKDSKLVPPELLGTDLSVCAVISEYGPLDLDGLYYYTGQNITTRKEKNKLMKNRPSAMDRWVLNLMGNDYHRLGFDKGSGLGLLPDILGCHPDECPEVYAYFSPITHIHKGCPPTLIIQGEHDLIAPVIAARRMYKRLDEADVSTVMCLLPQTDHAFDLALPRISPVAHTAFYVVERFLAVQANRLNPSLQEKTSASLTLENS
jgi:acetyl esterase/lipase